MGLAFYALSALAQLGRVLKTPALSSRQSLRRGISTAKSFAEGKSPQGVVD